MNLNLVIVFVFISIVIRNFSHAEYTDIVQTKNGPVRGEILTTILNGVQYSSFRGIPFAQPPVGENRFQPPQKPHSWTEVFDALNDPNSCPQIDTTLSVIGDEDCLYLNVYTPEVQLNSPNELKAVMVWIYGGGYAMGFINSSYYGPDFLMEKDVVVVAMNYRLGALGFLTLGNEIISGNAGLKDQALAIRWVNENIENFAGDPNKVTIFGQSAGAASIEFHHFSPHSEGLFRASIAMSGSPLNPWAINNLRKAVNMSVESIRAQIMSSFDADSAEDVSKLFDVPFDEFARLDDLGSLTSEDLTFTFAPTVEIDGTQNQPFITREPFFLYQSGDFYHVPHILGYMSNESVSFVGSLVPSYLGANETAINLLTNYGFRKGINLTRQFMLESSPEPIFYYQNAFQYPELLHKVAGVSLDGSGHSDDVAYLFYIPGKDQPLDPSDEVSIFRDKFLTLWTNFAKNLDPSAVLEDGTEINWPQTNDAGRLLLINSTFEILASDI